LLPEVETDFYFYGVCVTASRCEGKLNLGAAVQELRAADDIAGCKAIKLSDSTKFVGE